MVGSEKNENKQKVAVNGHFKTCFSGVEQNEMNRHCLWIFSKTRITPTLAIFRFLRNKNFFRGKNFFSQNFKLFFFTIVSKILSDVFWQNFKKLSFNFEI